MKLAEFEKIVAEEFPNAVPKRYHEHIKNVALLVDEDPSHEERLSQGLPPGVTLLGLYKGIPYDRRGAYYGVGGITYPDTITLYMNPILSQSGDDIDSIRRAVRATLWHEVAHYFGWSEGKVNDRERKGTNHTVH